MEGYSRATVTISRMHGVPILSLVLYEANVSLYNLAHSISCGWSPIVNITPGTQSVCQLLIHQTAVC